MLITLVELEDWKSYRRATIPFQQGTNAIIGPNGAGKSSILEAIGFCLFNYRSSSLAQCLREGAESGRVVVTLVSSFDEREYEIERTFSGKTTTRYRVLDPELGRAVIAEGSEDVQAWLRQHLCVAPTAALESLFENAVGVPQGTFTAPFLQPASIRKAIFNPLLQVEEYGEAAERLMDSQRLLTDRSVALNEGIARAEGSLARLPALEQEGDALASALGGLADRVASLEADLQAASAAVERCDVAERRARDAEGRTERASAEETAQSRLLEVARQALQEAVQSAVRRDAAVPGHRAYLEAERSFQALEARRTERDRLLAKRQAQESELARLSERSAANDRALHEVAEAEQRVAALAPQVLRQAELEESLRGASARAQQAALATNQASAARQEVSRAEEDLHSGEEGCARGQETRRTLDDLRARLEALAERGQQANADIATARAEVARLQRQQETLATTAAPRCPVCEADLTDAHRQDLLDRDQREIATLAERIRSLESDLKASRATYRRIAEQAQAAETTLRNLPGEAEVTRLRNVLEGRRANWQESAARSERLGGAAQELAAIELDLQALGDPRRQSQRYEDRAGQRPALEQEQAGLQLRRSAAERERASLNEALAAFDTLDADLQAARAARAQHEQAHSLFLANEQAAAQVEARRTRANALEASLAETQQVLSEATAAREAARAAYDADEHARLRTQANGLLAGLASARTEQEEKTARHRTVAKEVGALSTVAEQLTAERAALVEQQRLFDVVRLVRDLLRKAGPHITQQLVRHISREASGLYGDIMGDHAGVLNWSDDYDVTIEVRGHQRAFRQLSGGEQMTAALAVRLAALRETSAIDLALFDEPTAHLDPERRDALADSILQVKGFSQLFVISHDDTFERAAQSYIRITRDERGSRLADGQEG